MRHGIGRPELRLDSTYSGALYDRELGIKVRHRQKFARPLPASFYFMYLIYTKTSALVLIITKCLLTVERIQFKVFEEEEEKRENAGYYVLPAQLKIT